MQASLKWLLVPPALALLLFLGPLRDFGREGGRENGGGAESSAPETPVRPARTGGGEKAAKTPAVPSVPQTVGTLALVLALGTGFVWLLAKLKRGGGATKGDLIVVRQSARLSPRQQLHVVQWDDRLLLLGECDGKLAVLRETADPQVAADERQAIAAADDGDDGAVPRDMLIPRAPRAKAAVAAASASRANPKAKAVLAEFKALLSRAGADG